MNGTLNNTQTLSRQDLLIFLQPELQTQDLCPPCHMIFYRAWPLSSHFPNKKKSFELQAGWQFGPWVFMKNFLEIGGDSTVTSSPTPDPALQFSRVSWQLVREDLMVLRCGSVNCQCLVHGRELAQAEIRQENVLSNKPVIAASSASASFSLTLIGACFWQSFSSSLPTGCQQCHINNYALRHLLISAAGNLQAFC